MNEYDEVERRIGCTRGTNTGRMMPLPPALSSSPSYSLSMSSAISASSFQSQRSLASTSSFNSSSNWKSRCRMTGEYCAAGHELIQIPVVDRQRYLQRKEWLLQQQEELRSGGCHHPHEAPLSIAETASHAPIIIECDCCSKVMTKNQYIAGCCLECDIDVCGDCFKKGQSYIDVVLQESRENDMCDEQREEQELERQAYQNHERHNRHRPTYIGTGRVNYDDYPDPTVFQWKFTGSSDPNASVAPIEYFEKDFGKEIGVIRLDFYYTIGTVHTFIVDPVSGVVRELFTKSQQKMSQQSYRKILKDPRSYRNERYKKGANYYRERRR
mmetsp:Transcript_25017/g.59040  ORF Transcript_25017/g.59040 Transcript_25017/m.59040 type:complete len:327 (-) Transcript_25017:140-1120(-)